MTHILAKPTPPQFHLAECAVHARVEQFNQIVFEPREIDLCFRGAVERAFVVRRRREYPRRAAVAEREQRDCDAVEKPLNNDPRAGSAEGPADLDLIHGAFRFGGVGTNQHALAAREVAGSDNTFARGSGEFPGSNDVVKGSGGGGRNAVPLHEFLREDLR